MSTNEKITMFKSTSRQSKLFDQLRDAENIKSDKTMKRNEANKLVTTALIECSAEP